MKIFEVDPRDQSSIDWIIRESTSGSFELGFLPKSSIEHYIRSGGCLVLEQNSELTVFILFVVKDRRARILQLWTRRECRREFFAAELINHFVNLLEKFSIPVVSCWCREDLESKWFWLALGFYMIAYREGGTTKKILHVKFQRDTDAQHDRLFPIEEVVIDPTKLRREKDSPMRGRNLAKKPTFENRLSLYFGDDPE